MYSAVNEDSLMTEKLRRRGLHVGRHYGVDPFTSARVADIMSHEVDTLPVSTTVGQARARFAGGGHGAYPIVDDGRVVGIVARGDLLREGCEDDERLIDHASRQVLTIAPTERAQVALRLMVDEAIEHVPVVEEDLLVGICTRTDLLKVRRRQYELERPQAGLAARALDRLR